MKAENTDKIREKLISLIEAEYESDASFERAFGIPEKTVNNWRRSKSASFMRMLEDLAGFFRMNVGELMDIPITGTSTELSEEEVALLSLYRKTRTMPPKMRGALRDNLESTISMYITAYSELKKSERKLKQKEKEKKSAE